MTFLNCLLLFQKTLICSSSFNFIGRSYNFISLIKKVKGIKYNIIAIIPNYYFILFLLQFQILLWNFIKFF